MDAAFDRPLPGEPLALDLLNTTWQDGGRAVDLLGIDDAVRSFAASHGYDVGDIGAARSVLIEVRELVSQLLESGPGPVVPAVADRLDAVLADGRAVVDRDLGAITIVGPDAARTLAIAAVVDAMELLADRGHRVRSCEHDGCTLWFLDTSRSGRRRWCSMEVCGNRAKAKRHYDRRTGRSA